MSKLIGNKFWKLRTKIGRDKLFADGPELLAEAMKFWEWCDRHPWERTELVKHQGSASEYEIPLGRPYTMDGLTYYLGVSTAYFRAAKINLKNKIEAGKADESERVLLDHIEMIEQVVRTQNVEGAMVGVFNSNLVARVHNFAENVNQNNTGDAILRVTVRDQDTADNLEALNDLL